MSFKVKVNPLVAIAASCVYLLAELLLFKSAMLVPARVNGALILSRPGTSVGLVVKKAGYGMTPGNLLDGRGRLLLAGGGRPGELRVNGRAASTKRLVRRDDTIEVRRGTDVRVNATKTLSVIPVPVEYVGEGNYVTLKKEGAPGKRERIVLAANGSVISDRTLVAPRPRVFARTNSRPEKVVALTFDDGPNKTYTKAIIGILRRYRISATFFVVGRQVRKNPEMLRLMRRLGYQVENHSYSHSRMDRFPPEAIAAELDATRDLIVQNTGRAPVWFRPPYAAYGGGVYEMLSKKRYGLALWNVDSEDWKAASAGAIYKRVVSQAKPGSIVLFHDGGGDRSKTVAALPGVIEYLQRRGYALVTLNQLKAPATAGR